MSSVVILSGGMDSAVALAMEAAAYKTSEVVAVSFNYGQRHVKELEAARRLATFYNVEHVVVDLNASLGMLATGSALTSPTIAVPDGMYNAASMAVTVVPGRNMVFASLAASLAEARRLRNVVLGVHAGDHAIYPDCRPMFLSALGNAIYFSTDGLVTLKTPFANNSKAEIAAEGFTRGVPFHLTWSCYKGQEKHCGSCGTCIERREAFMLAGVVDPTPYDQAGYDKGTLILQDAGYTL